MEGVAGQVGGDIRTMEWKQAPVAIGRACIAGKVEPAMKATRNGKGRKAGWDTHSLHRNSSYNSFPYYLNPFDANIEEVSRSFVYSISVVLLQCVSTLTPMRIIRILCACTPLFRSEIGVCLPWERCPMQQEGSCRMSSSGKLPVHEQIVFPDPFGLQRVTHQGCPK